MAISEQVTKVNEVRHLEELWDQVVEAEMKANCLEVELTCTLENQQGAGPSKERPLGVILIPRLVAGFGVLPKHPGECVQGALVLTHMWRPLLRART